jgi:glucose-6-phosphate isomerase
LNASLQEAVRERLALLEREDVPRRIWERDHTVWRPDPQEISDRLGWLDVHREMLEQAEDLRLFVRDCVGDGLRTAVLAGMGGSSLAPEVFRAVFGVERGFLDLVLMDSTHPDQICAVDAVADPERTLFIVSSKSGTTIETRSHLEHLWQRVPDGSRFVAITDPGTPLADLAEERGFRRIFLNRPDIGGRYSALSYFGLVPAALVGVGLDRLLAGAAEMAEACGRQVPAEESPGFRLGALLGEAALAGRDKLTLALPDGAASFGSWVEQLIAESTGKIGRGILPVEGEALGPPGMFGSDRSFVAVGEAGANPILAWLERAGQPVERLDADRRLDLGSEIFRWELATAVAGAVIGVNPFDQPDVQASKTATTRILEAGATDIEPQGFDEVVARIEPPRYLAIQAFLARNDENRERLQIVRMRLRDALHVAVTVGFGPRYLHSTGQLHKGGPPTGVFVQVVEPAVRDVEIPNASYTFGELLAAQAAGDLEALRSRGKPAARTTLAELESATGLDT